MDKKEMTVVVRIVALEWLVSHLLFMASKASGNPLKELQEYRERVRLELTESTIPSADPVVSDLLIQELQEAVDRVIGSLIQRLQREASK